MTLKFSDYIFVLSTQSSSSLELDEPSDSQHTPSYEKSKQSEQRSLINFIKGGTVRRHGNELRK